MVLCFCVQLDAAWMAASAGLSVVIASGKDKDGVLQVTAGVFLPFFFLLVVICLPLCVPHPRLHPFALGSFPLDTLRHTPFAFLRAHFHLSKAKGDLSMLQLAYNPSKLQHMWCISTPHI